MESSSRQPSAASLEEKLDTLWSRILALERQVDLLSGQVNGANGSPVHYSKEHFACDQALRDALRHLAEPEYLGRCRLREQLAAQNGESIDGRAIQSMLLTTMRQVGYSPKGPATAELQRRRHLILRQRYVEGKTIREIVHALAISERQYYRDLKAAIRILAHEICQ